MPLKPNISFIVSTYNRQEELAICLSSLKIQRDVTFEVLVADNYLQSYEITRELTDELPNSKYFHTGRSCRDCYESANLLAKEARGEYLCFPSDDNYYTPVFGRQLYRFAKKFKLDLAYCDFVYDDRVIGSYSVVRTQPIVGCIDKGGFILRRDKFPGFKTDRRDKHVEWYADGMMIAQLRTTGIRFGKIGDVLWVHN